MFTISQACTKFSLKILADCGVLWVSLRFGYNSLIFMYGEQGLTSLLTFTNIMIIMQKNLNATVFLEKRRKYVFYSFILDLKYAI